MELDEREDEEAFEVDLEEAQKQVNTQWVAIGRFLSVRNYSTKGLFEVMNRAWRLRNVMEYTKLKDNKFLIEFKAAGDFDFVMRGALGSIVDMLSW